MVDITALLNGLPIAGLEPDRIAYIDGLLDSSNADQRRHFIRFLAPPASQRVPYVDPVDMLEGMLRSQGMSQRDAWELAMTALDQMEADLAPDRWVVFFDPFDEASRACLPVHDVLQWLRDDLHRALLPFDEHAASEDGGDEAVLSADEIPAKLVVFFEQVANVTARVPMFRGADEYDKPLSMADLPAVPLPKSMIEFLPGAPWYVFAWQNCSIADHPFAQWREVMRPIAQRLERVLGNPVYKFADLNSGTDDDNVHRFLVLHWCCTHRPESPFVRYLLRISGAGDVEELKAALIDPASYMQPFEIKDASIRLEARPACRFVYPHHDRTKTTVILFSTIAASHHAQNLLAQRIGMRVIVVAPSDLANTEWLQRAAPHCSSWELLQIHENILNQPIRLLSTADELCVIAEAKTSGRSFDLQLSEGAEDLLQLALNLGLPANYYHLDDGQPLKPESSLQAHGVPDRVAAKRKQRVAVMTAIREIRVECDFDSTGLWDDRGRMLSYDDLDLPFALVRRIAAWQRDYGETVNAPNEASADWWKTHRETHLELARALQIAVGSDIAVTVPSGGNWAAIANCEHQSDDNRPLLAPAQA